MGYEACRIAYDQCEGWLEECLAVITRNRDLVISFCREHFPQIRYSPLQATYLLWMDWNGLGLGWRELERINRQEAKLFFDEGYIFGSQGEGYERWNLACPTWAIQQALERMEQAYRPYLA